MVAQVPRPPLPADPVVLVSDNERVLQALLPQLHAEGFEPKVVAGADAARAAVASAGTRLIVLDVSCAGQGAAELCRQLRDAAGVPLIVFASMPTDIDLVDLLDSGADDYLPRPERLRELVARMRAVLRRHPAGGVAGTSLLRVGEVELDPDRHEVAVRGAPVVLTLKQFQLLELFLNHPGQVLPRATILRRVWGSDAPADSNTLEVQVKRLRRNIEVDPADPQLIKTVRGVGYLYADAPPIRPA
jgi:two-component system response regulator RegX3